MTKESPSLPPLSSYLLQTNSVIDTSGADKVGLARMVTKDNFAALNGVTCFALELWEECMRLPHWHPNAAELGYVVSGTIEIIIWRSPGEMAMFTLSAGMCWFIPQASLHSLNNIGPERAQLLVGFSSDRPQDIDLPVAFNGIPVPIRKAYAPHADLRRWNTVFKNPLVGHCPVDTALHKVMTGSPYGFDLAKVTPLFSEHALGSVIWGVKSNWSILESISVLRAHLKPGSARDAIWYPDAGTLYVVTQGRGQFHIIIAGQKPEPLEAKTGDFIFVPAGVLHTFMNIHHEDFEVTAFFTKADPQPEVSLSVATAFFPNEVRRAAMTQYGNEYRTGDPLKDLQFKTVNPYLLAISAQSQNEKVAEAAEALKMEV